MASCKRSKPRPVFAETVTNGAPRSCGKRRSKLSRSARSLSCLSSSMSHLFTATITARPSRSARSAMRKSCCSKGIAASSKTTTTSANLTARKPSDTESFSSLSCTLAFLRMPAVSKMRICVPSHSVRSEIASRVIPASGPVSKRSSPKIILISVDFPAFGRPTTAICIGFFAVGITKGASSSHSSSSSKLTSTSGASS